MRVSEKGQVAIPKELRDAFGIGAGTEVEFDVQGDRLVVRKVNDGRGRRVAGRLRGRGDVRMTTDEIMAHPRGLKVASGTASSDTLVDTNGTGDLEARKRRHWRTSSSVPMPQSRTSCCSPATVPDTGPTFRRLH